MKILPFLCIILILGVSGGLIIILGMSGITWFIGFITAYVGNIIFDITGGPEVMRKSFIHKWLLG